MTDVRTSRLLFSSSAFRDLAERDIIVQIINLNLFSHADRERHVGILAVVRDDLVSQFLIEAEGGSEGLAGLQDEEAVAARGGTLFERQDNLGGKTLAAVFLAREDALEFCRIRRYGLVTSARDGDVLIEDEGDAKGLVDAVVLIVFFALCMAADGLIQRVVEKPVKCVESGIRAVCEDCFHWVLLGFLVRDAGIGFGRIGSHGGKLFEIISMKKCNLRCSVHYGERSWFSLPIKVIALEEYWQ